MAPDLDTFDPRFKRNGAGDGTGDGLEYKSAVTGVKVLDEGEGIVQAIVSVTNIVDRVNDKILPGAYKKTLRERTPKGLRGHDWQRMVAKTLHAEELMPGDPRVKEISPRIARQGGGGLFVRGQYNLNTQVGREAYEDAKFFGDDMEFSIGYRVPKGQSRIVPRTGTREIKAMDLFEWSDVAFGAAPLTAGTASVKSAVAGMIEVGELTAEEILEWAELAGIKDLGEVLGRSRWDGYETECEGCGKEFSDKGSPDDRGAPGDPPDGPLSHAADDPPGSPPDNHLPDNHLCDDCFEKEHTELDLETKLRRVRTPEGAEKYGQPIGTVIRPGAGRVPKVPKRSRRPKGSRRPKLSAKGKTAVGKLNPDYPGLTKDGPPDVLTDDVEEALAALAEGKRVELRQPKQVSTLLNRLQEIVEDARSKGEKAPDYNLCGITVKGTNLFCTQHKDYTRLTMPQLAGKPRAGSKAEALLRQQNDDGLKEWVRLGNDPDDFEPGNEVNLADLYREHLRSLGVGTSQEQEKASHLKATQRELVGANVAGMVQSMLNTNPDGTPKDSTKRTMPPGRIFVSRDNYVVDGHHRWAAVVGVDLEDNVEGDLDMDVERVDMDILDLLALTTEWTIEMGVEPKGGGKGSGQASVEAQARKSDDLYGLDDDNLGFDLADVLDPLTDDQWGEVLDAIHEGDDLGDVKAHMDAVELEFKDEEGVGEGEQRARYLTSWWEGVYLGEKGMAAGEVEGLDDDPDGLERKVSSRVYPSLERRPGKQNWVDYAGGLPSYIERIAKHLHYERGFTISRAIATAVNRVKKWAAGGGGVKPSTRAKAAKAVAQWEAKKAKSKARTAARRAAKDLTGGAALATQPDLDGTNGEHEEEEEMAWTPPWEKALDDLTETDVAELVTMVEDWEEKVRKVRTPEGARKYGQPIGTVIRPGAGGGVARRVRTAAGARREGTPIGGRVAGPDYDERDFQDWLKTQDDYMVFVQSAGLEEDPDYEEELRERFMRDQMRRGKKEEGEEDLEGKREFSYGQRQELAEEGAAMPGGRYPIKNRGDLLNAIRAFGRGAPADKEAIRAHIKKRARALGLTDLIPDSWKEDDWNAGETKREFSSRRREELAEEGAAMPDGSYPIVNREDLRNAIHALGRAKNRAAVIRHIKKRARALGVSLPEGWPGETAEGVMGKSEDWDSDLDDLDPDVPDLDLDTKRQFSAEQRRAAAEEGAALPDGSYPIRNRSDLRNAIQAFGRAKDKPRVRRYIIKRARALGAVDMLPDSWNVEKAEDWEDIEEKAGRMLSGSNATAIREALGQLVRVLNRAGIVWGEGEGEEGTATKGAGRKGKRGRSGYPWGETTNTRVRDVGDEEGEGEEDEEGREEGDEGAGVAGAAEAEGEEGGEEEGAGEGEEDEERRRGRKVYLPLDELMEAAELRLSTV